MSNFITEYLYQYFDEVTPKEFYRDVFPAGSFEKKGVYETGKYNGIAVEISKEKIRRTIVTDELSQLDRLLKSDKFIIISPISYCGRTRKSENARFLYALAIDLDGVETEQHLRELFYQINDLEDVPKPTYVISSGNGVHLYYVFKEPIPLFKNIVKQLRELRNDLIRGIWNKYTTTEYKNVQYQSLFQGFRLVGGVTKKGDRTRAFLTGDKVDIEYLNNFVSDAHKVKEFTYQSKLTLAQAKEKYPGWYEKRIVKKQRKNTWVCKRDLFDWWYNRIKREKKLGHRYFCVMVLSIYAKKCGISEKELTQKALDLIPIFDAISISKDNEFTEYDVLSALELYNDNYITFPIDSITELTDIPIEKNKRNFIKQKDHLALARNRKKTMKELDIDFKNKEGRPKGIKKDVTKKGEQVREWQKKNPKGTKYQCIKETGISKPTVYKWWNEEE